MPPGYLEECFSRLSALKIKPSRSEVDGRKFRRWFRFTLQCRVDSVTTGRRLTSSPETRSKVIQATYCSEKDGNITSLGWSTRRDDDLTFPKKATAVISQKQRRCQRPGTNTLTRSNPWTQFRGLEGLGGSAGGPTQIRWWERCDKQARGGVWRLVAPHVCSKAALLCSDTRETLQDRSDDQRAHSSSEKTKPFILSRNAR